MGRKRSRLVCATTLGRAENMQSLFASCFWTMPPFRLFCIVLLSALVFLCLESGSCIRLESATYDIQSTNLLGNTYQYAVFEAQFDEEVYVMRQWACGCVNVSRPCGLSPSDVSSVVVNETGYSIATLTEGEWINGLVENNIDRLHYKFELNYDARRPCPMIVVHVDSELGTLTMTASNVEIPTSASRLWARAYYGQGDYTICPSAWNMTYGAYYITMSNEYGNTYNSFRLRYEVVNSPTCLGVNAPQSGAQNDGVDSVWVEDGVTIKSSVEEGAYVFYRLMSPGPCSNVSASVYGFEGIFDVDLFVSSEHPHPIGSDKSSFQWTGTIDGDDFVNFYVCSKDTGATTNIIYFGLRGVTSGTSTFAFTATSHQWMNPYPMSQQGLTQYINSMAFGATPTLSCADTSYKCRFTTYYACDADYNYDCGYLFSPVPPTDIVQTIWPWSEWDTTLGGGLSSYIPWHDTTPLVPGKLAWKLFLSRASYRSDGTGFHETLSTSNPATCKIALNTNLVDRSGLPLNITLSFEKKQKHCDYNIYSEIRHNISTLADSMIGETEIGQLGVQQSRINIATLHPSYEACQDFVSSFTDITTQSELVYGQNLCPFVAGTLSWLSDPCCNPDVAAHMCCRPQPIFVAKEVARVTNEARVKAKCSAPSCAANTVSDWSQMRSLVAHPTSGCAATFNKDSSLEELQAKTDFIDECRISLLGSQSLLGSRCNTSADCFYGATCDAVTFRCNHTEANVIDCLANKMDATTATILFASWSLTEEATVPRLIQELETRIMSDSQCYGSDALEYRNGYSYVEIFSDCVDQCRLDHRQPFCFDRTSPYCTIDPDCDGAQTDGACYRYWTAKVKNDASCLAHRICNWMECPADQSIDCKPMCENPTPYSSHVCVDCSGPSGRCRETTANITDSNRCSIGLCTTNASASNAGECLGVCSMACPSCNTKAGCQANTEALCTDDLVIRQALITANPSASYATGACVYVPTWDLSTSLYQCAGSGDLLSPLGCLNVSAENTSLCSSQWYQYASNAQECNSTQRYGCYDAIGGQWMTMNETECLACSTSASTKPYAWQPMFSWQVGVGVWTEGEMRPLKWIQRAYEAPNVLKRSIDFSALFTMIKTAVTSQFAYAYYTEAQCRYVVPSQLVQSVVCNCDSVKTKEEAKKCFSSAVDVPMGQGKGCSFLDSHISTRMASLRIYSTSFPPTGDASEACKVVSFSFTSASQFRLNTAQTVSQGLFRDSPTNAYWVVVNNQGAHVGQLVSGGVKVTIPVFPLAANVTLCIEPDSGISVASVATLSVLSSLDSSSSEISSVYESEQHSWTDAEGKICANVSRSGTYFASRVVPKYSTQVSSDRVAEAQYYVGAALYLSCLVFGVVQLGLLLRNWRDERILGNKITFISIILLNNVIRTVYVLLPANVFRGGLDSIQFIVFELPTFLYFSVFTAIIYMWLLVVVKAKLWARRGEVAKRERQMRLAFAFANVTTYFVFVIFIFLIAILPETQKPSPCFIGSASSKASGVVYNIKLAYWIFQFIVVFLVSLGFSIGTITLSRTFFYSGKSINGQRSKYCLQMSIISIVGITCMIFLLIRSAYFLWAAKTGKTVNIIAFVILEVIPQAMLLFYMRPFFCFHEPDSSSSSSSAKDKKKRHSVSVSHYDSTQLSARSNVSNGSSKLSNATDADSEQ